MRRRWVRLASVGVAALGTASGLAACSTERVSPTATEGSAQPLGMFSTELADDPLVQARRAYEQDAWRREQRFIDAVDPGYTFRSTRVGQGALERGEWSSDEVFQLGAQLFHAPLGAAEGFGAADLPALNRFHFGRRGGPDAHRCASCHWRGGPAGGGDAADNAYFDGDGSRQSSAFARNPISLAGAGYVEIVAREMTRALAAARASATAEALRTGKARRFAVTAKGIEFGFATVHPDGTLDAAEVVGLDADLVVRPFGWKGSFATIRDVVEDALNVHHGMQSSHLVTHAPSARTGRFASTTPWDPDGDGVVDEITEGQVSALTLFVAMQELPQIEIATEPFLPPAIWADGRSQFEELGCAECHTPALPLEETTFVLESRFGGDDLTVDLAKDGAVPRIHPEHDGSVRLFLYSDLKRHDMGSDLAEARPDRGVAGNLFLTRPLWGSARSRPYLHDARAPTIQDAIALHGGEAAESRDAFLALTEDEQAPVRVFLASMTRARRLLVFQ